MGNDDLQEQINQMQGTISVFGERLSSMMKMHEECKKLQKERLENTGIAITAVTSIVDKFQENTIRSINKFQERTVDDINDLSNADALINSNLNIVTNDVKEIIEYKKEINGRITKLAIAILTAILIALSIRGIDWIFKMSRISEDNKRTIETHARPDADSKPAGK